MRLYLQLTDAAGVLHEIEMPAFSEGARIIGVDDLPDGKVLRLATSDGEARVVMPAGFSPDWVIAGWRRE